MDKKVWEKRKLGLMFIVSSLFLSRKLSLTNVHNLEENCSVHFLGKSTTERGKHVFWHLGSSTHIQYLDRPAGGISLMTLRGSFHGRQGMVVTSTGWNGCIAHSGEKAGRVWWPGHSWEVCIVAAPPSVCCRHLLLHLSQLLNHLTYLPPTLCNLFQCFAVAI